MKAPMASGMLAWKAPVKPSVAIGVMPTGGWL